MLALIFQVGKDMVALDVRRIHEVVPRVRLSSISGGPHWIAGVFVYRGRIVPVIDLHRLTGMGECPSHLSSRIILLPYPVDAPQSLIGLLATQVAEIREVSPNSVQSLPGQSSGPYLGPPMPDGAGILRLFDPDLLLGQLTTAFDGLREIVNV
jgi:chemotaxis-related protein WspB